MSELIETMPGANTAPPVLLLQGTGGTNREILEFGRRLAPQSPLLTIAGRQGVGAQRQYYTQTASTPAQPAQVDRELRWVVAQAQLVCREHHWDVTRLVTVGYSNGAALGAYGVRRGLLPGRLALLFHPLWLTVAQPLADPQREIWLSAGQRDPLVSPATVQKIAGACRDLGMSATVDVTGGTHQLTPQEVLAAYQWLTDRL
ncbi:esterase [Levilactobacillus zymae]|uniref:alpha/beta hydrolase n=1 Tax=Levilactobacillus zymae TaxID=267363 RepID=UPI0028BC9E2C|nr:esterase [Levilactobacillus zymae]MDT6981287.1 esterase [Levilactobacillus zymae]